MKQSRLGAFDANIKFSAEETAVEQPFAYSVRNFR
jgi:hypothetical protein